jgi:DNA-directed RNA polymerase subunit alpha
VNIDAHIATITNSKGEIEMEMEVGPGIGYVPVEQQERDKKEVGVIAVDAIYTPIKRVNYTIENMRVGKRTDFERINLEITTDGSITPEAAFTKSSDILVDQFTVLQKIEEAKKEKKEAKEEQEEIAPLLKTEEKGADVADTLVTDLKSLSTRTLNVLEKGKVNKLGDILKYTEEQLGNLEGMGAKGIKEIKKAIGDFGFNLKKGE